MSSPQTVQSFQTSQTSRVPLTSIDNRPMVAPQKDALNAVPDLQKVYEKDGDEERKEDPDSENDEAGTDGDENSDKGSEADSEESDVPRRKPFKRGRDQTRIRDNQEDLSGSEDSVEKPFSKSSPGSKCQVESDSESSQDISPGRKRKFSKPVVSNDGEVEDDDFQMTAKPKDPAPGSYCSKPLLRNRDAGSDGDDKQDDESDVHELRDPRRLSDDFDNILAASRSNRKRRSEKMSMKGITPGHTEGECSPGHTEGECSQQVTKSRTPFSQIQNTKNENLPEEFFIAECTQKANGKHRDEHCVQNDDAGSNHGNEEGKMEAACSENLLEKDVSQRKTPKAKKRKSRRLRINLEESDGDEEARVSMCQARNQYTDNVNREVEAVSSDEEEGEEADDLPLEREKSDTENIDRGASSSVKRLNRSSMNKHNPETKRCTDSSFRSGHASPEHIERLESGLKQRGIISQGQKLETTSDQICLTKVEDLGWTAGRCSCGKEGLRYLFHIKNKLTKKETYVGSRCILLFKLCKEIAETVKMLLCNGITGTLIDKDNLKFQIQKNTGLVKHSKEMKKLGSLPLHRDSKRGRQILTVRAGEGIGSKVLEMEEGLMYKIRLQLTFKEDTDGFGLWQAEMIDFVSVTKGMMQSTHSDANNDGTEKKGTKKDSKGSQWDADSKDSDMDADSEDSDMDANSEEYGTDADSDGSDMGGDSQESDWYVDRGHRTRTGGPKRRNCQESDTDESAEESDSVDLEDANPSLHQSNQCKSRNTSRDKCQTTSASKSSQSDACGRKRKMGKESKNKKRKRQKTSNKREIKVELKLRTEDSTPVNWIVVTSPASTSASHQEIVRVKIEDRKIENGNRSTVRTVTHVSLGGSKKERERPVKNRRQEKMDE